MNAFTPARRAISSELRWPTWQGCLTPPLAKTPTDTDPVSSHARAVGLLMAGMTPDGSPAGTRVSADACLSSFVDGRLLMAEQLLDSNNPDAAAVCLAETYQTLLAILQQTPHLGIWHQSTLWHSRRCHCALLNHVQEYGAHPAIDAAFRVGCLTLCMPIAHLH